MLAHQVGIVAHCLRDWAEDNTSLCQLLLEGGLYRYRVQHRIHSHTGQDLLLFERNTELVESGFQLGVHLVHRGELLFLLWRSEVDDIVEVNLGNIEVSPLRMFQREPMAVGLQAQFEQPLRLSLLL